MKTLTDLQTAALARTIEQAEAVAMLTSQFGGTLDDAEFAAIRRTDKWAFAIKRLMKRSLFAGIDEAAFSELTFIARRLHVWHAIKDLPRLRPVTTPKGVAKAIRLALRPVPAKVEVAGVEFDSDQQAELEAVAALKKVATTPKRLAAVAYEALKADPAMMHALAISLLNETWHAVNAVIAEGNQKPWGQPTGAFLKEMDAADLFKLPEGATYEIDRYEARARLENALADKQRAQAEAKRLAAKRRRELKKLAK